MELDMDITPYNYKKNKQLSPFLSAKLSGNVLNRVFAQNCDLLVGRGRVAVHWVELYARSSMRGSCQVIGCCQVT